MRRHWRARSDAAKRSITALTRVEDVPTTFTHNGQRWSPQNYDGRYLGWVGPRTALEQSLNVATVKFAERVGYETVVTLRPTYGPARQTGAPSLAGPRCL